MRASSNQIKSCIISHTGGISQRPNGGVLCASSHPSWWLNVWTYSSINIDARRRASGSLEKKFYLRNYLIWLKNSIKINIHIIPPSCLNKGDLDAS